METGLQETERETGLPRNGKKETGLPRNGKETELPQNGKKKETSKIGRRPRKPKTTAEIIGKGVTAKIEYRIGKGWDGTTLRVMRTRDRGLDEAWTFVEDEPTKPLTRRMKQKMRRSEVGGKRQRLLL